MRSLRRCSSVLSTARLIGQYAVYFDDPQLINTVVDKQEAVTAGQVDAVAKKYLVKEQRTVVVTLPGAQASTTSASEAK